jgi:hypothetical protein
MLVILLEAEERLHLFTVVHPVRTRADSPAPGGQHHFWVTRPVNSACRRSRIAMTPPAGCRGRSRARRRSQREPPPTFRGPAVLRPRTACGRARRSAAHRPPEHLALALPGQPPSTYWSRVRARREPRLRSGEDAGTSGTQRHMPAHDDERGRRSRVLLLDGCGSDAGADRVPGGHLPVVQRRASASWPSRRSHACGAAALPMAADGREASWPTRRRRCARRAGTASCRRPPAPRRPHRRPTGRRTAADWPRSTSSTRRIPACARVLMFLLPTESSEFLATRACSSSSALPVTRAARPAAARRARSRSCRPPAR